MCLWGGRGRRRDSYYCGLRGKQNNRFLPTESRPERLMNQLKYKTRGCLPDAINYQHYDGRTSTVCFRHTILVVSNLSPRMNHKASCVGLRSNNIARSTYIVVILSRPFCVFRIVLKYEPERTMIILCDIRRRQSRRPFLSWCLRQPPPVHAPLCMPQRDVTMRAWMMLNRMWRELTKKSEPRLGGVPGPTE